MQQELFLVNLYLHIYNIPIYEIWVEIKIIFKVVVNDKADALGASVAHG